MADAHHDAAERHQRRGGKAEFFRAQQRGHHDIAAGFELAIGLNHDPAAEIVQQQGLVRFGEAEFPRGAGMFDGGQR